MRQPPLIMRCNILQPSTSVDSVGQPVETGTETKEVPCYWWSQSTLRNESAGVTAVEGEHLVVALGTNITPGDHITEVSNEHGDVIFGATEWRLVEHVTIQRNHIDCVLRYGQPVGGRL